MPDAGAASHAGPSGVDPRHSRRRGSRRRRVLAPPVGHARSRRRWSSSRSGSWSGPRARRGRPPAARARRSARWPRRRSRWSCSPTPRGSTCARCAATSPAGAAARDRPSAHDRARRAPRRALFDQLSSPRPWSSPSCWRRRTPRSARRSSPTRGSRPHPPGPQRRERAQRRHLRPAAAHRPGRRRRRRRPRERPSRAHRRPRGDRLRIVGGVAAGAAAAAWSSSPDVAG